MECKTIAERLRESRIDGNWLCLGSFIAQLTGEDEPSCPDDTGDRLTCYVCYESQLRKLADAIEAEQRSDKVDVDALLKLADAFGEFSSKPSYELYLITPAMASKWARTVRDAVKGANPSKSRELPEGVDVDALLELANTIEGQRDWVADNIATGKIASNLDALNHWANAIRKAVKGVPSWSDLKGILADKKPQLPEGIEWPRFEDGELVKFGDKTDKGTVYSVDFSKSIYTLYQSDAFQAGRGMYGEPVKRPEPEVLDADGIPIKVWDTVWYVDHAGEAVEHTVERFGKNGFHSETMVFFENGNWMSPNELTHRKPDSLNAIMEDLVEAVKSEDGPELEPFFERYRKLMGGE